MSVPDFRHRDKRGEKEEAGMARGIEHEGGRFHVVKWGNCRRSLFGTEMGAETHAEARRTQRRKSWRLPRIYLWHECPRSGDVLCQFISSMSLSAPSASPCESMNLPQASITSPFAGVTWTCSPASRACRVGSIWRERQGSTITMEWQKGWRWDALGEPGHDGAYPPGLGTMSIGCAAVGLVPRVGCDR